jgi:ABC-type transporter Mla maintaining outer membrane lipid asymmetry permease subunit MlaE
VAGGVGEKVGGFLAATTKVTEEVLLTPLWLLPCWKNPIWGLRFFLHYLRLIAGPSAWAYIAISGMIIGFVTTYFTFRFLPYEQYTKPLLIENLLMSMGFALYRILVPILATILIAARCGAAVASDVGGKSYGRQMDAMRTMGMWPKYYLLTPILYSFLLGGPLLTLFSYVVAGATSLVAFVATHPDRGPDFWSLHFHARLAVPDQALFIGTWWLLGKILLCAIGIGLIAYYQGARPKYSSRDVSIGITATILWSTLYVLIVHFAFAFIEFD